MMTMPRIALCTALIGAAASLAGCAPSGSGAPGAAALTPKQAATLDKQLAGKTPGTPVKCLPNYRSMDSIRVSDDILLYRSGRNLVYRNTLKGSCPGLARDSDIMVVRQFGSSTCEGDFFYLVDRSSGKIVASPGFVVSDRTVAYVKAHPTGSVRFSGSLAPGAHLKSSVRITAIPDARGYGYVYLNDRPALVDTGSRTVVWVE